MTKKNKSEIIAFIYTHRTVQITYDDKWQNRLLKGLKNKKNNENQILFWLHEYLVKKDIVLTDKDGDEVDLTQACKYSEDSLNIKHKDWSKKYKEWFGSFFSDLSDYKFKISEQGYKHISSTIAVLLREGYNFQIKEGFNSDEETVFSLPSCKELSDLAKDIRRNTGELQPQPKKIFAIWQKINNQKLTEENQELLVNKCFRKKVI